jgi:hypothetical protein
LKIKIKKINFHIFSFIYRSEKMYQSAGLMAPPQDGEKTREQIFVFSCQRRKKIKFSRPKKAEENNTSVLFFSRHKPEKVPLTKNA